MNFCLALSPCCGIVILGIFIGIIGEALVSRNTRKLRQESKQMSTRVLTTLAGHFNHNQPSAELKSNGQQEKRTILEEIILIAKLEGPTLALLFVIALGIGYVEGWSPLDR